MKLLVPVKRVVDYNVQVRVKTDQSGIDTDNVKMSMNPFCEIAVEEAIKIKEAGQADEVIAVSIGPQKVQETLRTALALGADRGIFIESDTDLEPLAIAKLLQKVAEKETVDAVIMGKQAIDGDNNQTGQMLSALLGWSQGTFISALEIDNDTAKVTREVDAGLETIELKMPAVFTVDLRLNEPRNASLPNIMKAKKKPIDSLSIEELGVDVSPRTEIVKVAPPEKRKAGIMVGSVSELVDKLKNEAKVI
ncbi:MAG: electron transfer flavoprotein subunit beta/FixA family protein [Arenicella sp.]